MSESPVDRVRRLRPTSQPTKRPQDDLHAALALGFLGAVVSESPVDRARRLRPTSEPPRRPHDDPRTALGSSAQEVTANWSAVDRARSRRPTAGTQNRRGERRRRTLASVTLPRVAVRSEKSLAALARGSAIHCRRLLMSWARMPATTIQSVLYPTLTLLMFRVAFGDAVSATTGQKSVYGSVPMITLVAAMSGAVVSGFGLTTDGRSGLLSRFATLPVHRAAGLVGRLLAEGTRVLFSTVFVLGVGLCLGFEFRQGLSASLALIGIPVMFGVGFAMLVTTLATVSNAMLMINLVTIGNTLLMFFNTGFVPVHDYPAWLQPAVAHQPMSCAIDAMRGLSIGGPVAGPLLQTVAWSVGLVVVFAYPAIRGIHRTAQRG